MRRRREERTVELGSPEGSSDVIPTELHSVLASDKITSVQAVGFHHFFASIKEKKEDESVHSMG